MVLRTLPMLPRKTSRASQGSRAPQLWSCDKAAAKRELRKGLVSTLTLQTSILKPFEKLLSPVSNLVTSQFGAVSQVKVGLNGVLRQKLAVHNEIRVESEAQGAKISDASHPLIWTSPGQRVLERCLF